MPRHTYQEGSPFPSLRVTLGTVLFGWQRRNVDGGIQANQQAKLHSARESGSAQGAPPPHTASSPLQAQHSVTARVGASPRFRLLPTERPKAHTAGGPPLLKHTHKKNAIRKHRTGNRKSCQTQTKKIFLCFSLCVCVPICLNFFPPPPVFHKNYQSSLQSLQQSEFRSPYRQFFFSSSSFP